MKSYKVVSVIVLLLTVPLILFLADTNKPNANDKSIMVSNAASADSNNKLLLESSEQYNDKDINDIMKEIDSKVKEINDRLIGNFYEDYYDGDIIMFRHFNRDAEQESFAEYYLYYNGQGKLIYADIAHYRGALYSIYFHNDELLHVEVGPSYEGGLSINGNMKDVKAVINKDSSYTFVLEDCSLCLEYAYK